MLLQSLCSGVVVGDLLPDNKLETRMQTDC